MKARSSRMGRGWAGRLAARWPAVSWRRSFAGIALVIRLEAVLFFIAMAVILALLIMPWALDTHPLRYPHGPHRPGVSTIVHAGTLLRILGTLTLTALIAVATVLHEFGHAAALRRAGATEITITIFGAGGVCRAEARDTTPLALFRYAAAGPLVTAVLVMALIAVRIGVPMPHAVHALLWLAAAIEVGILALNVLPLLARSDGGHMLRALTTLLGGGRWARHTAELALTLPVLALAATLQPAARTAFLWMAVSALLGAAPALAALIAARRSSPAERPAEVGPAIAFWSMPHCREREERRPLLT